MDIEKLTQVAIAIVIMAAATGQLPKLVRGVQIAQYKLLKDSQTSKWGRAMLFSNQESLSKSK